MSSAQVVCSRKRSLLRTFGSRRRRNDFAVSASIQTQVNFPVVSPAQPIHKLNEANKREKWSQHADDVEQNRAIAAYKDGEIQHDSTEAVRLQASTVGKQPSTQPVDRPGDAESPPISPFSKHPVGLLHPQSAETSHQKSALERSSLSFTRIREVHHRSSRRYTISSIQLSETAELLHLLDTSTMDSMTSTDQKGTRGQSRASVETHGVLTAEETWPLGLPAGCPRRANDEEVNGKIREMLAATDALKPPGLTSAKAGSRKLPRVAQSKVLTKMSDALVRIKSFSFSPEFPSVRSRNVQAEGAQRSTLTRSLSQIDRSHASVNSLELRLNEGMNLNRNKVQKMVGTPAPHEPIRFSEHSLPIISVSEPGTLNESLNDALRRTSRQSAADAGAGTATRVQPEVCSPNPFATEHDFECNLDRGILSMPPAASSTPRIQNNRGSGATHEECSMEDWSDSSCGQINLARVVELGKQRAGYPVRRVEFGISGQEERLGKPRTQAEKTSHGNAGGDAAAKKHPSPSKRQLEELGRALQRYKLPEGLCVDDDTDELAEGSPTLSDAKLQKETERSRRAGASQQQLACASNSSLPSSGQLGQI